VTDALPPLSLRTVMLCGLTGNVNSARNRPPPWFESAPISWLLEVTNTCRVAFALVLVASTRSLRLPASYSARVIATESGAGVACGVTVKPTLRYATGSTTTAAPKQSRPAANRVRAITGFFVMPDDIKPRAHLDPPEGAIVFENIADCVRSRSTC